MQPGSYRAVPSDAGDGPLPPARLDLRFLRRLWRLIRIGLADRFPGLILLALVASIALWQVLVFFVGILPSGFYRSLLARDREGFQLVLGKSILLIGGVTLSIAAMKYFEGLLSIYWRTALCNFLHERYLNRTMYYKLNVLDRKVDNPDQRITSDVDRFTQTARSMITNLVSSPLMIVYYTYMTWKFLGPLGPLSLFTYFVVGTVISKYIMAPIVPLVERQEKLEGDFRFAHVAVRNFAESVAFYREKAAVNDGLQSVAENSRKLLNWQFPLNLWTDFFAYIGAVMSYLLLAVPVFGGFFDSLFARNDNGAEVAELISQSAFASLMLIAGFTNLIQLAQSFSDLAGYTARICDLIERVEKLEQKQYEWGTSPAWTAEGIAQGTWREGDTLHFRNATCYTPEGRLLVRDLSLELPRGRNLLITGPSGSGKSSLLRVLSELWPVLVGEITKPPLQSLFFVPQVPYIGRGSLRDLLFYPDSSSTRPALDDELTELLNLVHLSHLTEFPDRLSHDAPWADILSPGEQQRLSIARMLLRRPTYAILDESTSAVDVNVEAQLYALFRQRGITVISVGHRPSLKTYHDLLLELDASAGGTWRVTALHS